MNPEIATQRYNDGPDQVRLNPNVLQRRAAEPAASVWVDASAGAGKTKVLTDRVLRLLLPRSEDAQGTSAHKILCLTFTRAAASEMAMRLNAKLGSWAIMPLDDPGADKDLRSELANLLGRGPRDDEIRAARRLFTQVVDAPGGLKIMTLHAFCQSVLGRFPLEAGIAPNFTPLDAGQASHLLEQARARAIDRARRETGSALNAALERLAGQLDIPQFNALLGEIIKQRHQLKDAIGHWGIDNLYQRICATLGIPTDTTDAGLVESACQEDAFAGAALRRVCAEMRASDKKGDLQAGARMAQWLGGDIDVRIANYADYCQAFLTQKGTIRNKLVTNTVLDNVPDAGDIMQKEAERLYALEEQRRALACAQATYDLMLLGAAILEDYDALKRARVTMDFDDMILSVRDLLEGRTSAVTGEAVTPWVRYKLDEGLDHILIDEAQDTNPEQWQILSRLSDDFFSGEGAHENIRTVFGVGDKKQSIYSFQRAAPREFDERRAAFQSAALAAGQDWENVPMDISFRSTAAVLEAVDATFKSPEMYYSLGQDAPPKHDVWRSGQAGLVELWPVFEPEEEQDEIDPWEPPTRVIERTSARARLARFIADKIAGWIGREELPARARAVRPGDIMILLRSRGALVADLVRALKNRNVPVSGADRMILNDQLAVQDLLALARFALMPDDDLNLANVLKSPLIGWDDNDLMAFAPQRAQDQSLWQALRHYIHDSREDAQDVLDFLMRAISSAGRDHAFEFFSSILQAPCPGDCLSGMRAFQRRLGHDAVDPIEELLSASLAHEEEDVPGLQGFVAWQAESGGEIKRELAEAGDEVRIMTVHGAKGLQSPIVILPDTMRVQRTPPNAPEQRIIWPEQSGLDVPLYAPRKEAAPALYRETQAMLDARADQEYRRLLYVAMTRAEDRLYVTGMKGGREPLDASWYYDIQHGMEAHEHTQHLISGNSESKILRLSYPQHREPDISGGGVARQDERPVLPGWLFVPAPTEPSPPRPLVPTRPSQSDPPVTSPLARGDDGHFTRGLVTHKLLQVLPDLAEDQRPDAAARYVANHAAGLSDEVRDEIVRETLAILQHPDFAPIFGPGSQAEVPLTGLLGETQLISAQIDRLLVREHDILIVDYKTNRPPPEKPGDVPGQYYEQMRGYARALAQVYPDRPIQCALIWTDGPVMMPLDISPPTS